MTALAVEPLQALVEAAGRTGAAPPVTRGQGMSRGLPDVVPCPGDRVLVVASPGTTARVAGVGALLADGAVGYHEVGTNPTTRQALALSAVLDHLRPRVVVTVGGGSAIDLAKAARMLRPARSSLDAGLRGDPQALRTDPPYLLAVPTTAGTGSEVTPFATLYHGGKKVSLDVPGVRPDHALLDGLLVTSCPPRVAVAAALDALCHAIESIWNRHATAVSLRYAAAAADTLVRCLAAGRPVVERLDPQMGEHRLLAATAAGVAIAQTRTTAAHAFSYRLTAQQGLAHGFACALNLVWLARHNWEAHDNDRDDLGHVLRRLGCHPGADQGTPVPTVSRVLKAAAHAGLLEFPRLTDAELSAQIAAGLAVRDRADRNPVALDPDRVREHIIASGLLTAPSETIHHPRLGRITR
ncbi:MAG: iron-containing alcohol dehydrogenase [Actinoallomurus sp.]